MGAQINRLGAHSFDGLIRVPLDITSRRFHAGTPGRAPAALGWEPSLNPHRSAPQQSEDAARITRIGTLQGGPAPRRLPLPRTKSNASRLPLVGRVAGVGRLPCCRLTAVRLGPVRPSGAGASRSGAPGRGPAVGAGALPLAPGPSAHDHARRYSVEVKGLAGGRVQASAPASPFTIHHLPFLFTTRWRLRGARITLAGKGQGGPTL